MHNIREFSPIDTHHIFKSALLAPERMVHEKNMNTHCSFFWPSFILESYIVFFLFYTVLIEL